MSAQKTTTDKMNLEQKIAKLEELAATMERSDTPLTEALAVFEQSINLASDCLETLNDASGKLQVLTAEVKRLSDEE